MYVSLMIKPHSLLSFTYLYLCKNTCCEYCLVSFQDMSSVDVQDHLKLTVKNNKIC